MRAENVMKVSPAIAEFANFQAYSGVIRIAMVVVDFLARCLLVAGAATQCCGAAAQLPGAAKTQLFIADRLLERCSSRIQDLRAKFVHLTCDR
jgi:hypothetical protein